LIFHEYTPCIGLYDLQTHFKKIGFVGVDIFFLLSGIGLTYSIKKSTIRRFYYKRFRRIIFPFLAVGILRAVVENWGVRKFIGNITGFNFWTVSIYSFLWFIPAIVMFYLIFPLYNHFLKKIPVLFVLPIHKKRIRFMFLLKIFFY